MLPLRRSQPDRDLTFQVVQDDGKLVLLDFGQCKALSATRHKALAQLIVTMDEGNKLAIALAMSRFGMDFTALGGGLPDPELIQTIALIVFDTRCSLIITLSCEEISFSYERSFRKRQACERSSITIFVFM